MGEGSKRAPWGAWQTPTPNSSTDQLLKSVAGTLTDRSVCCCAGHLREVCLSATQWLWLVEFLRAAAWISLDQGSRIKAAIEMDRGFPVEPTWVTASDFPFPTSSLFPIMSLFHKPYGNLSSQLDCKNTKVWSRKENESGLDGSTTYEVWNREQRKNLTIFGQTFYIYIPAGSAYLCPTFAIFQI